MVDLIANRILDIDFWRAATSRFIGNILLPRPLLYPVVGCEFPHIDYLRNSLDIFSSTYRVQCRIPHLLFASLQFLYRSTGMLEPLSNMVVF